MTYHQDWTGEAESNRDGDRYVVCLCVYVCVLKVCLCPLRDSGSLVEVRHIPEAGLCVTPQSCKLKKRFALI